MSKCAQMVWAVFSKNTVKFEAINPESMQQKTAATLQPGIGGQKQAHRLILDTRVVLDTRVAYIPGWYTIDHHGLTFAGAVYGTP